MVIDESDIIHEDKEKQKHFRIVQGVFLDSAVKAGIHKPQVLKVKYVVNPELRKKFKKTEKEFKDAGKPTDKIYGFHGTKEDNLPKIFEEGCKIGGKTTTETHGDCFGKGVYLGTSPKLPDSYTKGTYYATVVNCTVDIIVTVMCKVLVESLWLRFCLVAVLMT